MKHVLSQRRSRASAIQKQNEVSELAKDPVCGMDVDEEKAAATSEYKGKTYHFCCNACKAAFDKDPEKYAKGEMKHGRC